MKDEKSDLQKHLEEQFKKMLPTEEAPESLKKDVFQTLDTLNLIGDIADLFTAKFSQTEAAFFGLTDDDLSIEEQDDEGSNQ